MSADVVPAAGTRSLLRRRGASVARVTGARITRERPYLPGLVIGVLCYAAFLQIVYVEIMEPTYASIGFHYRTPHFTNYSVAILLAVLTAIVLPRRIVHVSDMLLWFLYVIAAAPSILIPQYNPLLTYTRASLLGLHIAICLILMRSLAALRPRLYLETHAVRFRRYSPVFALGLTVAVFGGLALTGGLSFSAVGIYEVYARRTEFQFTQGGNVIAGYLAPAFFEVLGPTMMALGLYYKRRSLFLASAAAQLLLYTSLADKTILFSVVAIAVLPRIFRSGHVVRGYGLLRGAVIGATSFVLFDLATGGITLSDLFVRRFLFIPGVFASIYASVFWDAGKTNFNDTLPLFASHAPGGNNSPAIVVGQQFFHGSTNASASLWMHGYGSYGFTGMYIETLVFVVLLWIADDCTKDLPLVLSVSIFFMPGLAITQASAFTVILTHGYLAAFLVATLIQRPQVTGKPPPDG